LASKPNPREWTRLIPGLLVSAVCLGIILYLIDPVKLVAALKTADYRFISGGIFMTALWLVVRSLAWRTLLQDRASLWDVFISLNEGYLMNNILPFRLGEVGRAFLLGRKSKLDFWQIIPTVIVERSLDLAFGVGLFLSTVPFVVGAEWAVQAAIGSGVLIAVGLLGLFLVARFRYKVIDILQKLGEKFPPLNRLVGNRAEVFLDGLSIMAKTGLFLRALALILLNWLIGVGQFYFYVRAFFPEGTLLWAAFSLGALALGMSAPSTPGNLGVYELALITALSLFVGEPSQPTALAITAHAIQYLVTGIPGAYGLLRDGESLTSLYQKTRNIK
jgi:glycosyltransferase 2 family protein